LIYLLTPLLATLKLIFTNSFEGREATTCFDLEREGEREEVSDCPRGNFVGFLGFWWFDCGIIRGIDGLISSKNSN
jgi:hypothetical protein